VDNHCVVHRACPQSRPRPLPTSLARPTVTEIEQNQPSRVAPKAVEDVTETRLGVRIDGVPASVMI